MIEDYAWYKKPDTAIFEALRQTNALVWKVDRVMHTSIYTESGCWGQKVLWESKEKS